MGKELGLRITESLQKRGMTQKELTNRIGVTEAVESRYISGDREPKPDVLANIATALHTTGKKSLHVHYFTNGIRSSKPVILSPGDDLYEKYKSLFKGVK